MTDIKDRTVMICTSKHCKSNGSEELVKQLEIMVQERGLKRKITIEEISCQHLHDYGPIIVIKPDHILYTYMNKVKLKDIFQEHLINSIILDKYLFKHSETGELIPTVEKAQMIVKPLKHKA